MFGLQEKRMGASSTWIVDEGLGAPLGVPDLALDSLLAEAALIVAQLIKERNEAVSPASLWYPCLLSGSAECRGESCR